MEIFVGEFYCILEIVPPKEFTPIDSHPCSAPSRGFTASYGREIETGVPYFDDTRYSLIELNYSFDESKQFTLNNV